MVNNLRSFLEVPRFVHEGHVPYSLTGLKSIYSLSCHLTLCLRYHFHPVTALPPFFSLSSLPHQSAPLYQYFDLFKVLSHCSYTFCLFYCSGSELFKEIPSPKSSSIFIKKRHTSFSSNRPISRTAFHQN